MRGLQPRRLFMSTRQTLNMLVRATRGTISDEERDAEIERIAARLTTSGPFQDHHVRRLRPQPRPSRGAGAAWRGLRESPMGRSTSLPCAPAPLARISRLRPLSPTSGTPLGEMGALCAERGIIPVPGVEPRLVGEQVEHP
jgi:hypothetical protein